MIGSAAVKNTLYWSSNITTKFAQLIEKLSFQHQIHRVEIHPYY